MKLNRLNRQISRTAQSAFTLIEVVVGVSIILVVFVAIFAVMTMGLSITQTSRENLRATQIMLDKMEGVRLYSWTQLNDPTFLQSSFTNWFYETNNVGLNAAQGSGIQYTGQIVVTTPPMSTSYSANVRLVTVNVGWVTGTNVVHNRSMSTLSSYFGMQNYIYYN